MSPSLLLVMAALGYAFPIKGERLAAHMNRTNEAAESRGGSGGGSGVAVAASSVSADSPSIRGLEVAEA